MSVEYILMLLNELTPAREPLQELLSHPRTRNGVQEHPATLQEAAGVDGKETITQHRQCQRSAGLSVLLLTSLNDWTMKPRVRLTETMCLFWWL